MGTDKASLGAKGEQLAVEHLQSAGYEIIERNYRNNHDEIDIVARNAGDLVFVEVKTRRSSSFGYPSEAVDSRKQCKLIRAARGYLLEKDLGEIDCRFDIVEVYFMNGSSVTVEVMKGAFSA